MPFALNLSYLFLHHGMFFFILAKFYVVFIIPSNAASNWRKWSIKFELRPARNGLHCSSESYKIRDEGIKDRTGGNSAQNPQSPGNHSSDSETLEVSEEEMVSSPSFTLGFLVSIAALTCG